MSSGTTPTDNAYDPLPTQRSRDLRINATPAERKLWSVLSNRQLCGVRFNRQVVIRPFICDLVARSVRLVIEIDGGQHGEAIAYDQARTAFLEAKGYRVIRFWNNDVLDTLNTSTFRRRPARAPGPAQGASDCGAPDATL